MTSKTEYAAVIVPPVVSIIGRPDCGKTTLLEKLIPELTNQGYRVGTIKHHVHEFEMDKPGKDTWKHKQAGARVVALSSPAGLGVIRDTEYDSPVAELVHRYFYDVDIVFTEGYKQEAMPKIEVYRSSVHPAPLPERDATWTAMVSDTEVADDLPHFQPDKITDIAAFIIKTFIKPGPKAKATLFVDGKNIPLNTFVEKFIRKSILGMTSSLKGCDKAMQITITVRND
jgi:molybdopterin-guanine dinucleotide biosynthesis protein B